MQDRKDQRKKNGEQRENRELYQLDVHYTRYLNTLAVQEWQMMTVIFDRNFFAVKYKRKAEMKSY